MSKAFIAAVLQDSLDCTGVAATKTADDLVGAIVAELKQEGRVHAAVLWDLHGP